jgi:hypothetical protein
MTINIVGTMKEKIKETEVAVMATVIALTVLYILAGVIPLNKLWGFNHLKYHDPIFTIISAVLILLSLIPFIGRAIYRSARQMASAWKKLSPTIQIVILIILSYGLLYLLRVHVHSLGDGYQRIYQIEKGYMYYHSEPLDFFLHSAFYKFANVFTEVSGQIIYNGFSIVVGIIFTVIIVRFRFPDILNKYSGLIKFLILTLGGSQLYFGYVESYSLYYLFALIYVLLAVRYLYEKERLSIVAIVLALALISHLTAVILLPSFILLAYLLARRPDRKIKDYIIPIGIVALPLLALAGQEIWLRTVAAGYIPSIGGGILPLYSAEVYSILSPEHLMDILNQLLLIAPVLIPIFILLLFTGKSNGDHRRSGLSILLIVVPAFLMLFLLDPKLGYARDWDLFATPVALIGSTGIIYAITRCGDKINAVRLSPGLGMAAAVFFFGWILVNASLPRQLNRAEDLLTLSDAGRGYSTEMLAQYYRFEGKDSRKAVELLESIPLEGKNARVYSKIARGYLDLGENEKALQTLFKGLAKDSLFEQMNYTTGVCLLKLNRPEQAMSYLLRSNYFEPNRYNIHFYIGNTYFQLDSIKQAAAAFSNCVRTNPKYIPCYFETANMYRLLAQYDSAYVYIQQGLKLNPRYPNGYELLELIKTGLAEQINPSGKGD